MTRTALADALVLADMHIKWL